MKCFLGLNNLHRPIANFIFSGSIGVGKTELTKILAQYLFGSKEVIIYLKMSEFMDSYTVFELIGSPP